jgi:hypothetical protein
MGFPALADAERQSPSNRLSVENASVVLAPRAQGLALALRQELSKEKNSKGTFMNNFVVYNVALELVRALRPIVAELRTHSSNIADQIERAGTSLVLNLGEGNRRAGKDRRRFFVIAQGSDASDPRRARCRGCVGLDRRCAACSRPPRSRARVAVGPRASPRAAALLAAAGVRSRGLGHDRRYASPDPDPAGDRMRPGCLQLTRSTRAGTCLCHGVPTNGSRSSTEVSSLSATPVVPEPG